MRLRALVSDRSVEQLAADDERRASVGRDLVRVIAGPSPLQSGTQLLSVEIYRESILVRWRRDLIDSHGESWPQLALRDDHGQEFAAAGGGGSGTGGDWRGRSAFVGQLAGSAAVLSVSVGDLVFTVDLAGEGRIR